MGGWTKVRQNFKSRVGKHVDGKCEQCGVMESVQQVLMECEKYKEERKTLKTAMETEKQTFSLINLLKVGNKTHLERLMDYFRGKQG